jgi:hypothetical protein
MQSPADRGYHRLSSTAVAKAVVACPDGNEARAYGAGKQGKVAKKVPAPGALGRARQLMFLRI